jgi:hypothetical protein
MCNRSSRHHYLQPLIHICLPTNLVWMNVFLESIQNCTKHIILQYFLLLFLGTEVSNGPVILHIPSSYVTYDKMCVGHGLKVHLFCIRPFTCLQNSQNNRLRPIICHTSFLTTYLLKSATCKDTYLHDSSTALASMSILYSISGGGSHTSSTDASIFRSCRNVGVVL